MATAAAAGSTRSPISRPAAIAAGAASWRRPAGSICIAGIYGPGRSALDTVRQGRAQRIDKPGQVFSRIHVADLAAVLRASMARPDPGVIYNVCDDDPAPPEAVIAHACALLGVEPPPLVPFDTADLSPMARSFYDDNKRVSNRRLKEVLGVTLAYPSYKDGLQALLSE
jgi:nucleoside-diphosphate-sugar epimerase